MGKWQKVLEKLGKSAVREGELGKSAIREDEIDLLAKGLKSSYDDILDTGVNGKSEVRTLMEKPELDGPMAAKELILDRIIRHSKTGPKADNFDTGYDAMIRKGAENPNYNPLDLDTMNLEEGGVLSLADKLAKHRRQMERAFPVKKKP